MGNPAINGESPFPGISLRRRPTAIRDETTKPRDRNVERRTKALGFIPLIGFLPGVTSHVAPHQNEAIASLR